MKRPTPGLLEPTRSPRLECPLLKASARTVSLPPWISKRGQLVPASDQKETPQCAGYSLTAVMEWNDWRLTGCAEQISPDAIYEAAKLIDGYPEEGTTIEAAITAATKLGLLRMKPNSLVMIPKEGALFSVKRAIHRYGFVIAAFGITTAWLTTGRSGWIRKGGEWFGAHAVPLFGYDDEESTPWIEGNNSWGIKYGNNGNFRIPQKLFPEQFYYAYAFDFA